MVLWTILLQYKQAVKDCSLSNHTFAAGIITVKFIGPCYSVNR